MDKKRPNVVKKCYNSSPHELKKGKSYFFFVILQTGRFCRIRPRFPNAGCNLTQTDNMAKHKIIFVTQEISPYLNYTPNARLGNSLPQSIQQRKYEVRTFMPDFGEINERRNQLHEVIRLSGLNVAIGENDHPLTVKVASLHPSRIQVYFMDNDDYFQKLADDSDPFGTNRADNDERMLFFARSTMETARKLQWEPVVMNVSGWMSALVPLYLNTLFRGDMSFAKTAIIYAIHPETEMDQIDPAFFSKLEADGLDPESLDEFRNEPLTHKLLHKMAIRHSAALVFHGVEPDEELKAYAESLGIPVLQFDADSDHADDYDALYKRLMTTE